MSKRKRTSTSANGSEDDEREECNSSRSSESGGEEADDVKNVETRDGEEPDVADVTTHIDTKESEPRYEVRAIWTAKDPRVWSFEEYPDPTSRDNLARGTRRFRYLGPFRHLSWQDLNDMAHEVAHFIWQTYSDMNPLEVFVQTPTVRNDVLYLDIATTTQKAYEQLAKAQIGFRSKPFELVSSCAPFPSHHILMRIDGIDVRNALVSIINSIKVELHGLVRIIAYWARFRPRSDDGVPSDDDFTGTVYVLGAERATRFRPTSFQAFSTSRTSTGQSAWPCCTTGVLLSATLVAGWSHATSSGTALNAATAREVTHGSSLRRSSRPLERAWVLLPPTRPTNDMTQKITSLMNMVFAYGGAMIPERMAEMRRPPDFCKGMISAPQPEHSRVGQ
ncbi:cytoplasmic tryptophanyl-tRNA synthetase [Moesziomyces antarcticus T-34]|uniref:Cytoplasmic tryptophanyl-tRNA synthetase n=1 Tax=Pseudozyma antarctica (strain T-34) TaxID=1151754 RepID=M9LYP7_PSEA3|nr:cytoplasmic tryptophanyl-tRNA synthetase [Moesziomyces antarcticus T-34]